MRNLIFAHLMSATFFLRENIFHQDSTKAHSSYIPASLHKLKNKLLGVTLPVSKPHCSKHLSHHEMRPGTNPTWDDHDKNFPNARRRRWWNYSQITARTACKQKNVWLLSAHSILLVLVRNRVYDWIILSRLTPHMKCRSSSSLTGFGFSGFMRSLETLAGVCLFLFQPPAAFCMLKQAKSTTKFSAVFFTTAITVALI